MRIAKESIFSGLNNISVHTVLNEVFNDKFGLLESEVNELLEAYDLAPQLPAARQWYDGYRMGSTAGIYNPWSVLKYIYEKGALAPYWVNTSDNALVKTPSAKAEGFSQETVFTANWDPKLTVTPYCVTRVFRVILLRLYLPTVLCNIEEKED